MTDYGLGTESNERICTAIKEFKKCMVNDDPDSFMTAVKNNKVKLLLDYDLSELERDLVALIVFGPKDGVNKSSTVYIDRDVDDYNLFFYLAHEVGHHIMHYQAGTEIPQFKSREKNYSFSRISLEEKEADVFAYNLLMPYDRFCKVFNALKELHKTDKKKIINDLSEYFYTGEEFILKRIEFLNLEC